MKRIRGEKKREILGKWFDTANGIMDLIGMSANAQLLSDMEWMIEWIEKHEAAALGYDWSKREGAPIIVIAVDPLEIISLKDKLKEMKK